MSAPQIQNTALLPGEGGLHSTSDSDHNIHKTDDAGPKNPNPILADVAGPSFQYHSDPCGPTQI